MATNMPGGLDTFVNPSAGSTEDGVPHHSQHSNANDSIKAIEKITVGPTYWNIKGEGGVGNGSGNDSTAIANAYTNAPAGAIMRFPAGRYMIDPDTLVLIASRKIEGDGQYNSQLALRSDTANALIKVDITTASPDGAGHVRGAYGPTIKGIGLDLGLAPSAKGIYVTANSGWAWLDDVRVEGGAISFHNQGANTKITNCHFVNPSTNFMKLDNALELRVTDVIMTLTTGTIPAAILLTVTSGGTALYMSQVHCNNTGTIQKGLSAIAPSNMSVPIRAFDVVFDNIAGPSWNLEHIMDVIVTGGWSNSANGGNDPAVRILGGQDISFIQTLMNGGAGSGSGWASIEFVGGSPANCVFVANRLNTGPYYRFTGASSGDPTNLFLMDALGGASIIDLGNLTNEPDRLAAAMTRIWTPAVMAVAPMIRESGTAPPAGYNILGSGGTKTIAHTGIKTNTRVLVTRERPSGTVGEIYCSVADNIVGTSFTVRSMDPADRSGFYWRIWDAV